MPMSATVVCNNILKRAFSESVAVSPMKLQKLLYFVSCEYVKATGNDLFRKILACGSMAPFSLPYMMSLNPLRALPSINMLQMQTV